MNLPVVFRQVFFILNNPLSFSELTPCNQIHPVVQTTRHQQIITLEYNLHCP